MDASQGYKRAHNWTRGTSKASQLPTHMWRKGKFIRHPHEMGSYLLEDWSKIWTQELDEEMPHQLWGKIKSLIVLNSSTTKEREKISQDDVKRGIKAMKSGTAVGIDQWPPTHWKMLSPEAIDSITYLLCVARTSILQHHSAHGETDRRFQADSTNANAI